jgi:hypothetical protein
MTTVAAAAAPMPITADKERAGADDTLPTTSGTIDDDDDEPNKVDEATNEVRAVTSDDDVNKDNNDAIDEITGVGVIVVVGTCGIDVRLDGDDNDDDDDDVVGEQPLE